MISPMLDIYCDAFDVFLGGVEIGCGRFVANGPTKFLKLKSI